MMSSVLFKVTALVLVSQSSDANLELGVSGCPTEAVGMLCTQMAASAAALLKLSLALAAGRHDTHRSSRRKT